MIKEFNISYSEKEISTIYNKIKDYPWQSMPSVDHWKYGTNYKYLKTLWFYLREAYKN